MKWLGSVGSSLAVKAMKGCITGCSDAEVHLTFCGDAWYMPAMREQAYTV